MTLPANVDKAEIRIVYPSSAMGGSGKGGEVARFKVQFNPKEYTIQKSANWESKPSTSADQAPMPEFKGANARQLTLDLLLDATDPSTSDISATVERLFECCTPLKKTKTMKKPSAPFVEFGWGKLHFTAHVKQVNAKYTLFDTGGVPLRATCSLTLEEIPSPKAKQNPTSGGLATTASHRIVSGDSLASIAYEEYRDPAQWRRVAEANGIDDPLRLRSGTLLLIPPPESEPDER